MQIKHIISTCALMIVTIILAGCGGGSGSTTPAVSGVTAGVITGVDGSASGKTIALTGAAGSGSIQINCEEYSLNGTNIIKDDDDDQLSTGMVVTVKSHDGGAGSG
ncbi:MAG: hypothetical protein HZC44_07350, partial [Geobacter sp.]|nr:hypothetical protein [Geobacter sp.]